MRKMWCKIFCFVLGLVLLTGPLASAAVLKDIRFAAASNRLVLEMDKIPSHSVTKSADGKSIVLSLAGVTDKAANRPVVKSTLVKFMRTETTEKGLKLLFEFTSPVGITFKTLGNPNRLLVDFAAGKESGEAEQTNQAPQPAIEEPKETNTEKEIAPGLTHYTYTRSGEEGAIALHVLKADPKTYKLDMGLASAGKFATDSLDNIAKGKNAVAAINGVYFSSVTGKIFGFLKNESEVISSYGENRTSLAEKEDGSIVMGYPVYNGDFALGSAEGKIDGVNRERKAGEIILYTAAYGKNTGNNEGGIEFLIWRDKVSLIQAHAPLNEGSVVISVPKEKKALFANVKPGDPAIILSGVAGEFEGAKWVLGGGPRLLEKGNIKITSQNEGFSPKVSSRREARTAFGITKNGEYLFAVVGGKKQNSDGATPEEMAKIMLKYGAQDAMLFEGGTASAMFLDGKTYADDNPKSISALLLIKQAPGA